MHTLISNIVGTISEKRALGGLALIFLSVICILLVGPLVARHIKSLFGNHAAASASRLSATTPKLDGFQGIPHKGEIEGQIFIVTKGGETIKLSLTDVLVFDQADLVSQLTAHRQRLVQEKRNAELRRAEIGRRASQVYEEIQQFKATHSASEAYSAEYRKFALDKRVEAASLEAQMAAVRQHYNPVPFFQNLPPPRAKTTTDADGKFAVSIPKHGHYVIVAVAQREVADQTETYYWAVRASLGDADSTSVALTNKNTAGSFSPESLL